MSHDRLITELSSQLAPVRRRSVAREAVWLVGLGALQLIVILNSGLMRPDMGDAVGHPFMWWKLGGLALLVATSILTAVRSFSPVGSPRRGLIFLTGAIGLIALLGAIVSPGGAVAPTLAGRLAPTHGLICATSIVVLALPMLGMLTYLMRNGASAHTESSAVAVGLAGGSWGAFVFAFCCLVNDPLYIVVWYSLGCAVVALLARFILPRIAAL
jgi:hypothetical protein